MPLPPLCTPFSLQRPCHPHRHLTPGPRFGPLLAQAAHSGEGSGQHGSQKELSPRDLHMEEGAVLKGTQGACAHTQTAYIVFMVRWFTHVHRRKFEKYKKYNKNQNPLIPPPRQVSTNSLMHFLSVLCLRVCVCSFQGLFQGCVVSLSRLSVLAPIPQGSLCRCSVTDLALTAQILRHHFCFNILKIILNCFSFSWWILDSSRHTTK